MPSLYDEYYDIAKDILMHDAYQKQKAYYHHTTNLFDHAVLVSYYAFKLSKKLHLDSKSVVRGALLHDFFLYDWRVEGKKIRKRLFKKHGFTHAKTAYKNALIYFELNKKEKDIILKHMFPLNLKPPRYLESWLVNIVDSMVTIREYFKKKKSRGILVYIEHKEKE
ncbi:MAG: HD domain-containing protein [Candidatus Izemoplasmataceae bacterium]|jgi:uncharacterized protein|uniref:HD domain-containing protein n=1 Tax=Liberiplasma polymorphum TaxID=3374570 RepID=UPI0037740A9C